MYFVTGNLHKREEANAILWGNLERIDLDLEEIQTTQVEEVVKHKAKLAYQKTWKPVFVEDVGLVFEARNQLPWALTKRFMGEVGAEGLLTMLKDFPNRKAKAICCVGFCKGEEVFITKGIVEGEIAETIRGSRTFGRDPIFIPKGYEKTFWELGAEVKNQISHRAQAWKAMKKQLEQKD